MHKETRSTVQCCHLKCLRVDFRCLNYNPPLSSVAPCVQENRRDCSPSSAITAEIFWILSKVICFRQLFGHRSSWSSVRRRDALRGRNRAPIGVSVDLKVIVVALVSAGIAPVKPFYCTYLQLGFVREGTGFSVQPITTRLGFGGLGADRLATLQVQQSPLSVPTSQFATFELSSRDNPSQALNFQDRISRCPAVMLPPCSCSSAVLHSLMRGDM